MIRLIHVQLSTCYGDSIEVRGMNLAVWPSTLARRKILRPGRDRMANTPILNLNRPLDARKFLFFRIFKNQNSDLKRLFLTEKMEEPEFLKDPGITEPLDDHLGPFILISDWLSRHEPSYSLTAIQSESIFIN